MFKQTSFRDWIGKDALVEYANVQQMVSRCIKNKVKLEEIAIITVNAEYSAIIMNQVPEKLEDPGKFLIPFLLNTPLSDKVECFAPKDNNDEIDDFLAMEVSSNFEEGYFDSEGDITFLDNLLSDDASHNLASEVISDHEPEQNESSITFSPRSDPLHHEFAGEPLTLPARNDREFEEHLSLMTDSEPTQEEIDIFLVPNDLILPGVEDDDSEEEVNELPNLDHQDDPSIPHPPPEPPDVEKCFEPEAGVTQQFLKTLVSSVISRFTRASHPLCEISLGKSDIFSSDRFTFIFA
ncbi:hypothetical protein Tco_0047768 [Tanacetum coccineum]